MNRIRRTKSALALSVLVAWCGLVLAPGCSTQPDGNDNGQPPANDNGQPPANDNLNDNGTEPDGNANDNGAPPSGEARIGFYAVYDRLVDTDDIGAGIGHAALSDDGRKLIFSGADVDTAGPVLFTINADGSDLTPIPLPDLDGRGITEVAIDEDGSRAFFRASAPYHSDQLYKVEGTSVAAVLDAADTDPPMTTIQMIQCTTDGLDVYFLDKGGYNGDIWRIGHGGGTPQKIIEDTEVPRQDSGGGMGYMVDEFAVSDDGQTVAFVLFGYFDAEDIHVINSKPEVFVLDAGGISQLTNDSEYVSKAQLAVSGDGSTIVFSAWENPPAWYAMSPDGGSPTALETPSFNFGGVDLTYDGAQMFYDDDGADGGRLTQTDGSERLDLFPEWNVATIALAVTWHASISDDGRRVAFIFQYSAWPFKEALYVGHLDDPDAVSDAPRIDNIFFEPGAMPRNDSEATVTASAEITDPQGLADVVRTSTDELLGGVHKDWSELPAYFNHAVHDDGVAPDLTADDATFTSDCKPGDMVMLVDEMTVRIGAQDDSHTVVIADADMNVGEATGGFTLDISTRGQGDVDVAYGDDDQATLTAVADEGWQFDHWEGDLTGSGNPQALTLNSDKNVTAVFVEVAPSEFTFYAVYDRLVDTDAIGANITHAALSDDGRRLIFSGADLDTAEPVLYTIYADGTHLTFIPLPDLDGRGITEVAIDQDGSRAFFRASAPYHSDQLYRVEGTSVTAVLDAADTDPPLATIQMIQCTADGVDVYFLDSGGYNGDVWRIGHGGGTPHKVIEDTEVSRQDSSGGMGYMVDEFAISDGGEPLAFILTGYFDAENIHVINTKPEVFVLESGAIRQLTNDSESVSKTQLAISGDGSTIVFSVWEGPASWYAMTVGDGAETVLERALFNFGGVDLTGDGTEMVYVDAAADGGRLVQTDGSGPLDLFPAWNVAAITLAATWHAEISDDGQRVAFMFQYSTWPFKEAVYVGHLNDPDALGDAPRIESIAFQPPAMPRNDPQARVTASAVISDPQGLADVARTSTDELLEGVHKTSADLPAYFNFAVHDDAVTPDLSAGDGMFTSDCKPGDMIAAVDEMTVRVGAQDNSHTVVIADTTMAIGG